MLSDNICTVAVLIVIENKIKLATAVISTMAEWPDFTARQVRNPASSGLARALRELKLEVV